MNNSVLIEIENSFKQLSMTEQLRLIERLVHHVNEVTVKGRTAFT